jgi:hypothetical protein
MTRGKALRRPRMKHMRCGQPASSQPSHSFPGAAVALATMKQLRAPQPSQPSPKGPQAVEVPGYRMVVEVALHDRLEPLPRLRHRRVPAPPELLLDLLQLVGIEPERADLQVEGYQPRPFGCEVGSPFHHGHVSRGPPIIPDSRFSRVRFGTLAFLPWAFPVG